MNPIVTAILLYLNTHNLGNQADRQRYAQEIDQRVTYLPHNRTTADEETAIEHYLEHDMNLTSVDAHAHGPALHADIIAARANNNRSGNRGGGANNTNVQTPPASAPAQRSNVGLIIATLVAALVAAILAGWAAFRDNGMSKLDKIEHGVYTDAGQGVAEVALATHDGIKKLAPTLATKDDLLPLAKSTDVQGLSTKLDSIDTKVGHVEKVVVGALTFTDAKKPCKDGELPKENIINLRGFARASDLAGVVHQGDLAGLATSDQFDGLAKRGELQAAFANQGTIAVVTEGDAELRTGADAIRTPPPPSPASVTPPAPASVPASAAL